MHVCGRVADAFVPEPGGAGGLEYISVGSKDSISGIA